MGSKVVWKNARGVCSICLAIKATWKIPAVDISGILFQTVCNAWIRCTPLPPPWGRAGERAFSRMAAIFPNTLTTSIQALRLVALSLALSHGREDGAAVGIKGFARKTNCSGCFFSFQMPYNQWQTQESRSPHVGCVRYARTRSPFSLQPQPTACVPCGTHLTDGFKGRLKKRSRRLFYLPCDKGYLKNSCRWCFGHYFFRRPVTPESAATCSLLRGGGLGRGHLPKLRQPSPTP